jgi:hypothetical protein
MWPYHNACWVCSCWFMTRRQDEVDIMESHRRRERLVDEMLELEEDEVNVDEWT